MLAANGPAGRALERLKAQCSELFPTWASCLERMTGIEPALSAWEADVLPLNYIRALASAGAGLGSPTHRTGTGRQVGRSCPIVALAGPPGPVRVTRPGQTARWLLQRIETAAPRAREERSP
jgi:hypothetical protein